VLRSERRTPVCATLSNPEARKCLRWITRVTLITTDPSPVRFDPRSIDFDELRRCAAAETNLQRPPRRRPHSFQIGPSDPDRTVRFPRADRTVRTPPFRSDRPNRNASKLLDLDPVAQIRRYPFSRGYFVKEPLSFLETNPLSSVVQK
jgi:hypothetical protein